MRSANFGIGYSITKLPASPKVECLVYTCERTNLSDVRYSNPTKLRNLYIHRLRKCRFIEFTQEIMCVIRDTVIFDHFITNWC